MPRTPWEKAAVRINALVKTKPVTRRLAAMIEKAPERAEQAMGVAVAWWHRESVMHMPVRGSKVSQRQRGMLKQRTQPYIGRRGSDVKGSIISAVDYAIWLAAGTGPHIIRARNAKALRWINPKTGQPVFRKSVKVSGIAGGRVLQWKMGDPTIKHWPAKDEGGGSPQAELPIILPWQQEAAQQFTEGLAETVTDG